MNFGYGGQANQGFVKKRNRVIRGRGDSKDDNGNNIRKGITKTGKGKRGLISAEG
jgi:hypothetical protein